MQKARFIDKKRRITLPEHFAETNVIISGDENTFIVRKAKVEPIMSEVARERLDRGLEQAAKGEVEEFDPSKELEEFERLQNS